MNKTIKHIVDDIEAEALDISKTCRYPNIDENDKVYGAISSSEIILWLVNCLRIELNKRSKK